MGTADIFRGMTIGLVDLATGEAETIGTTAGAEGEQIVNATFSPDGARLLMTTIGSGLVIVRDIASGEDAVVAELANIDQGLTVPGLRWSSDGCGFVRWDDGSEQAWQRIAIPE